MCRAELYIGAMRSIRNVVIPIELSIYEDQMYKVFMKYRRIDNPSSTLLVNAATKRRQTEEHPWIMTRITLWKIHKREDVEKDVFCYRCTRHSSDE